MTGQEAYNKWIMAKDVDEFRRVELAEMLDCLVKYVDELKAAQQPLAPDAGDSAPLQALSTPEHSATSQNLSTPTQRG